jgi:outer membrane protein
MKITALCLTAAAAALVGSTPALAQDSGGGVTIFGRTVSASLKARVSPDYMGSDDYRVVPAGSISLSKPGEDSRFSAPDDGASLTLVGGDALAAGLTGRVRGPRDGKDDLQGFDDVDWTVEAGGFVNWWVTDSLRTRLEVRRGFGGHEGVVVDVGADVVSVGDRLTLSIGPRFRWADDEYARAYFGVTPQEAARSPFAIAAYNPDGGASYAGVLASADYRWNDHWSITADADYRKLLGDAADSPIVAQLGSEDQYSASIGVRYSFGR